MILIKQIELPNQQSIYQIYQDSKLQTLTKGELEKILNFKIRYDLQLLLTLEDFTGILISESLETSVYLIIKGETYPSFTEFVKHLPPNLKAEGKELQKIVDQEQEYTIIELAV